MTNPKGAIKLGFPYFSLSVDDKPESEMAASFLPSFPSTEQFPVPQKLRNCSNCLILCPVLKQLACSHGICFECFNRKTIDSAPSVFLLCEKCDSEFSTSSMNLNSASLCKNCSENKKLSEFWACGECGTVSCSLCVLKEHRDHRIIEVYKISGFVSSRQELDPICEGDYSDILIDLATKLQDMFEKTTDLVLMEAKTRLERLFSERQQLVNASVQKQFQEHSENKEFFDEMEPEMIETLIRRCMEILKEQLSSTGISLVPSDARFEVLGHPLTLAYSVASCLFLDFPAQEHSKVDLSEAEIREVLGKFQEIQTTASSQEEEVEEEFETPEAAMAGEEPSEPSQHDDDEEEGASSESSNFLLLLPCPESSKEEEEEEEEEEEAPLKEEEQEEDKYLSAEEAVFPLDPVHLFDDESSDEPSALERSYSDTEVGRENTFSPVTRLLPLQQLPPAYSTLALYPMLPSADEPNERKPKRLAPSAPPATPPVIYSSPMNPEFSGKCC